MLCPEAMQALSFTEFNGKWVAHYPIRTKKALMNREIRLSITKNQAKYSIHLVDHTANRKTLLSAGAVTDIEKLVGLAKLATSLYEKFDG